MRRSISDILPSQSMSTFVTEDTLHCHHTVQDSFSHVMEMQSKFSKTFIY